MRIGIVGHEKAKFTPETEEYTFAEEEARAMGLQTIIHKPEVLNWQNGYRPRNIKIAESSDIVVSIVLKRLPLHWTGMRFDGCYHCLTDTHVKSGGCWTAHYAKRKLGKQAYWYEV
jgi:hypothetical protein